jgi:predicted deacylase
VRRGKQVLVFEGGQIHRFDATAIAAGVAGILRTLRVLGMGRWDEVSAPGPSQVAMSSSWIRSRHGGIADLAVGLGDHVERGAPVAVVADAFGAKPAEVRARFSGWVIGHTLNPLVGHGDPLVHLAAESMPATQG